MTMPQRSAPPLVERAELLGLGTLVGVRTGCPLVTEGTSGRDAFVVVDGSARVTKDGRLIGHVGPGAFVGETALIDHEPRSESVTATTPMQVIAFDAPGFAAFVADPIVARELRRHLVARLRDAYRSTSTATAINQIINRRNQP